VRACTAEAPVVGPEVPHPGTHCHASQSCMMLAGSCTGLPAPSSWHIPWPWWHGRSLQQRPSTAAALPGAGAASTPTAAAAVAARGVPMCLWNDVKEYCSPGQLVLLSLTAPPTTMMHRYLKQGSCVVHRIVWHRQAGCRAVALCSGPVCLAY
jgi:hypothetical protein